MIYQNIQRLLNHKKIKGFISSYNIKSKIGTIEIECLENNKRYRKCFFNIEDAKTDKDIDIEKSVPLPGSKIEFELIDDDDSKDSKSDDSKSKIKWHTLDHNGVVFAPEYEPHGIPILYDGKEIHLSPEQEEIATMYGVMIETDWVQKDKFRKNFMKEFTKILRDKKQSVQYPYIKDLDKCDFKAIHKWYLAKKRERKRK